MTDGSYCKLYSNDPLSLDTMMSVAQENAIAYSCCLIYILAIGNGHICYSLLKIIHGCLFIPRGKCLILYLILDSQ